MVKVLEHIFESNKETQYEIENILWEHQIADTNDVSLGWSAESIHESEVQTHRGQQKWNWKKALKDLNGVLNVPRNIYLAPLYLMK